MEPRTHSIVVPRTARFLTVGALEGELNDIVVLLHGYGQLASEILLGARVLERDTRLLVAPEALSRFYLDHPGRVGASWMTREDRLTEIEDYLRYLDLLYERIFALRARGSVTLRLLGFSQGAATATRWALRRETPVEHLILWGAPIPPELDDDESLSPLRETRLTLVGGSRDSLFTDAEWDDQRRRLSRFDVAFEEYRFEGGHRLDDDTLMRIFHDD